MFLLLIQSAAGNWKREGGPRTARGDAGWEAGLQTCHVSNRRPFCKKFPSTPGRSHLLTVKRSPIWPEGTSTLPYLGDSSRIESVAIARPMLTTEPIQTLKGASRVVC